MQMEKSFLDDTEEFSFFEFSDFLSFNENRICSFAEIGGNSPFLPEDQIFQKFY